MNPSQTLLDFPAPDRVRGFRLGWDHARHGLAPLATGLEIDSPLLQGWRAARAVHRLQHAPRHRHLRLWLALRLRALQQGRAFDEGRITPAFLAELDVSHCPVTRRPLGGSCREGDAPEVVAVGKGGWVAGRVVVVSRAAARAMAGVTCDDALQRARRAEAAGTAEAPGLDAGAWRRLASLLAFVEPAGHARCARLAATLLPPQRFEVLSPAYGLQAAITCQLASAGWSRRLRELAEHLGERDGREEFLLLMGALAPRVLELPQAVSGESAMRHALEDIWLDTRVQQRWQQCLLRWGEAMTRALLVRATGAGWPGVRETSPAAPAAVSRHRETARAPAATPAVPVPCLRRPARRHARRLSCATGAPTVQATAA